MRVGIFGGTFDPPHVGHLIVAQDAWAALELDRLLFIPAAVPPHKQEQRVSRGELRLEMLRAAVAGDARFAVEDLELRRPGPSYTVETLRELCARDPASRFFFLLGVDQFRELRTWREPEEVARLATLAVLSRSGAETEGDPLEWGYPHRMVQVTRVDLSATEVRRRVAAGEPIRYLVPAEVEAVIRREGLYRRPASGSNASRVEG